VSEPAPIACVGAGFVGLETALSFSEAGYDVTAVDIDSDVVAALDAGQAPSGAEVDADRITTAADAGRLRASTSVADAADATVYVLSVPTGVTGSNDPDLTSLQAAVEGVAAVLDGGDLVVQQSTVYPGCTREVVVDAVEDAGLTVGEDVAVAYVPERYSPGNDASKETPRVVGAMTAAGRDRTCRLYEDTGAETVPVSSLEVAESTKQLENIQRDVNIALMNEAAVALERMDVDVWEVIDAAGTKWNFHRYEPGLGVGGHCIAVDPYYFMYAARRAGHDLPLISAARRVNEGMTDHYADRIVSALDEREGGLTDATVAILGITYKPGVKDIRNSQALLVADTLASAGVTVTIYDPLYADEDVGDDVAYDLAANAASAAADADCLLLGTAHEEFAEIDLPALAAAAAENPLFADPYGFYDPDALEDAGFGVAPTTDTGSQEVVVSHE